MIDHKSAMDIAFMTLITKSAVLDEHGLLPPGAELIEFINQISSFVHIPDMAKAIYIPPR